ncbi:MULTISPECIES: DnaB-like helicase C-terminal domain-containing protein [unclassified Mycoplasma]|uniref:DnaB-like helicase C-terminal domain-containing protein n=1 Tax=unclassified Mycoplasma TaxID=2683645 RepID=UPI00211C02C0|nr:MULTISPECIES: DnaB-like helicase C-terminal domain-containing protein [unclassified Mycoplasma]UUM19709.1 AAA family ATPase [Mycoplasma sp. 1578d]UUM24692.1 AAA family ATPase [Mycoplasma sp. 3686d]
MSQNSKPETNYLTLINNFLNPQTLFQDDEIEKSILASMILDEEMQQRGAQYLKEDNFFVPENKQLFRYILFLKNKMGSAFPFFDFANLVQNLDQIKNNNAFTEVTPLLISLIASKIVNETHFLTNVEKLIDLTKMRNVEAYYEYEINKIKNGTGQMDWKEAYSNIQQFLSDNSQNSIQSSSFKHIYDTSQELLNSINERLTGVSEDFVIKTEFEAVDKFVNGFKPGQFIILAARPGIGKTAFALNIARNITLENLRASNDQIINSINDQDTKIRHVAFISLEMPASELTSRFLSTHSEIPLNKIQDPKRLNSYEKSKLDSFALSFDKMNVYFDDVPTSSIDDITWKLRLLNKNLNYQLDLIIIDYLQLISGPQGGRGNRQQEVSTISRNLKTLALEMKIPIMALSQLSRTVETREDKRPQLHDLRESGSIEQDADIVIFLSRNAEDKREDMSYNTLLSVAKNRNGQLGLAGLQYNGEIVSFTEFIKDSNK